MNSILSTLENFLQLSEAISRAVEAQQWEELAPLGAQRQAILGKLPENIEHHLSPDEVAHAQHLIARCQQLDETTCARVKERQEDLLILLRGFKTVN